MSTRDAVLAALRAAGSDGVSGEALARSLGVSRVAVGKHVASLRGAGYDIVAEPGVGYRLIAVADGPLPAEIAPLLGDAAWMELDRRRGDGVDERRRARAGARRRAARARSCSRLGRVVAGVGWDATWASPEGGAYLVDRAAAPGDSRRGRAARARGGSRDREGPVAESRR